MLAITTPFVDSLVSVASIAKADMPAASGMPDVRFSETVFNTAMSDIGAQSRHRSQEESELPVS